MQPVLTISGLCQAYGSHQVLKDLSLSLEAGEILGVIGENGAGKSTLVKVILGMLWPTAGTIRLSCSAAAIHQELNLADDLPVYGSFFLGRELRNRFGFLDIRRMAERVCKQMGRLGVTVDPYAETRTLSVSEKQMLVIASALDRDARLLILDEPSALLSEAETDRLFEIMAELKRAGTAMIFISHKLPEVREICDRVAILRDGELVAAGMAKDLTPLEMAERMVGRDLADIYPKLPPPSEKVALSFHSARGSFELHAGEILGVAGLADSGQAELGETLAGFRATQCQIKVNGRPVAFSSPRDARAAGIGFLTSDRLASGIWRDFSVAENIALGALPRMSRHGFISPSIVRMTADEYIDDFHIHCEDSEDYVGTLSGGNQQKVAIAKVLADKPSIVIFNEPTQGVDVGARQEIYRFMGQLASSGLAILLISSDMTELLGLCRRVVVLHEGEIAGEITGDQLNEKTIIRLATGTGDAVSA